MDAKTFINLLLFSCFIFLLRWLVIEAIWHSDEIDRKSAKKPAFWKRLSVMPAFWRRKGKHRLFLLLHPFITIRLR
jgi:hypothetical protein